MSKRRRADDLLGRLAEGVLHIGGHRLMDSCIVAMDYDSSNGINSRQISAMKQRFLRALQRSQCRSMRSTTLWYRCFVPSFLSACRLSGKRRAKPL